MPPVQLAARASNGNSRAMISFRRISVYVEPAPIRISPADTSMRRSSGRFQMLRSFRAASVPAANWTITSVPPAIGSHSRGLCGQQRQRIAAEMPGATKFVIGGIGFHGAAASRGFRYRLQNLCVSRAAAEIARKPFANFIHRAANCFDPADESPRESFRACRFRTARRRISEMRPAATRSADRSCTPSIVTIRAPCACATGIRQLSTSAPSIRHRASAALAFAASFFRAGQSEIVAEHVEQAAPWDRRRTVSRSPFTRKQNSRFSLCGEVIEHPPVREPRSHARATADTAS